MRIPLFLILSTALVACGGKSDDKQLPPPATFDASADTAKKDSTPDTAPDTRVADATDGSTTDAPDEAPTCITGKTCVGSPMPAWQLEDFQPKSAGFKKTYGLSAFKGRVTLVALLSSS